MKFLADRAGYKIVILDSLGFSRHKDPTNLGLCPRFWGSLSQLIPLNRVITITNIYIKKKPFTINAKIEDVGLNEDTETRNGY